LIGVKERREPPCRPMLRCIAATLELLQQTVRTVQPRVPR
jgi:hypothetical protein